MKKYDKKVTVSLTTADFETLEQIAEDDRRTPNQMASIFLEDAIASRMGKVQKADQPTTTNVAPRAVQVA